MKSVSITAVFYIGASGAVLLLRRKEPGKLSLKGVLVNRALIRMSLNKYFHNGGIKPPVTKGNVVKTFLRRSDE